MATQKMHYVADAVEAKEIDRISIQEIGIPSMVLMERAAMSVASCIMETTDPESDSILAVCGTGNNGGDGVAAIRILQEAGYSVSVLILGQIEKCSEEMRQQIAIAEKLGISVKFYTGPK
ncbi:MAG: NAD(P)H-hydrate epimerase, partial [Lachnospiraceae bacterium]|nr:NAD(P)H-hydrate epimerase [Lachnospiraceae bacterium]